MQVTGSTAFAIQESDNTETGLPKQIELLVDQASKRQAILLDQGFDAMAGEEKAVKLTSIVKVLRTFGYGAKSSSERPSRNRGVGQGRGHDHRSYGERHGGGHSGGPADRFAMMDTNGDQKLTGGEIGPRLQGTARAADGEVSLEEFEAAWGELFGAGRRGEGGNRGQQAGNRRDNQGADNGVSNRRRGGRKGSGKARTGDSVIGDAVFVLSFDSNRDRKVTKNELQAAIRQNLLVLVLPILKRDSNKDGVIDESEALSTPDTSEQSKQSPIPIRAADQDGDGKLTAEEIAIYAEQRSSPRTKAIAGCLLLKELLKTESDQVTKSQLTSLLNSDKAVIEALDHIGGDSTEKSDIYQLLRRAYHASRIDRVETTEVD